MKPLSVEMACLLGIQNEMQAVWAEQEFFDKTKKNPALGLRFKGSYIF